VAQHIELPKSLEAIHKKYGDRAPIDIVDNSAATSKKIPIEKLASLAYTGTRHELLAEQQAALDKLHASGAISAELHRQLSRADRGGGNGGPERGGSQSAKGQAPGQVEPLSLKHPPSDIGVKQFVAALQRLSFFVDQSAGFVYCDPIAESKLLVF
jgi:hypothetical protein